MCEIYFECLTILLACQLTAFCCVQAGRMTIPSLDIFATSVSQNCLLIHSKHQSKQQSWHGQGDSVCGPTSGSGTGLQ